MARRSAKPCDPLMHFPYRFKLRNRVGDRRAADLDFEWRLGWLEADEEMRARREEVESNMRRRQLELFDAR